MIFNVLEPWAPPSNPQISPLGGLGLQPGLDYLFVEVHYKRKKEIR